MNKSEPLQYEEAVRLTLLVVAAIFGATAVVIDVVGDKPVWFAITMGAAFLFLTVHEASDKDGFWRRAWETVPGIDIDDG